jgi:anthranilate phosphoribosyltransferase
VLKALGSQEAWIAHGQDGMDEITNTAPTDIVELRQGLVRHFALSPEELGLPRAKPDDLRGGDATHNAEALKQLLHGARGSYRDIVLMNAAAALAVAGKNDDLRLNLLHAEEAIDTGAARQTLDLLVKLTNGPRA